MNASKAVAVVSLCASASIGLGGEFFLSEDDFLANVNVIDTNAFDDVVAGAQDSYSYSAGAYAYTISSTDSQGAGLGNQDGLVMMAGGNETMLITFTGAPITAFGANFWAEDASGDDGVGAYIIINISNGDEIIHSSTSSSNFWSYASDTAFTSIEISYSGGSLEPVYAAVDNFVIAHTVPAPGAMALLGLGGALVTRRRRG